MPEGHVTHRAARLQGGKFVGQKVRVSSPQGRFAESAAKVDQSTLESIEALGKHLFYRFSTGDIVHVHLGLFGKFRLSKAPFPRPSENARFLLWTDAHEMQLTGPNTCEILGPDEVEGIKSKLGPDPIGDSFSGEQRFGDALSKRKVPIGRALLDQKVSAGLGNIFRSELLFLAGLNPHIPSNELSAEQVQTLWKAAVASLEAAERSGRIVTVAACDANGVAPSKLRRSETLYTYHRDGSACRRCGTLIAKNKIDSRNIWWCPACQPAQTVTAG